MNAPSKEDALGMFERASTFSAPLFAIRGDFEVAPGLYCGTGVLVSGADASYLLTAAHVWDVLHKKSDDSFGLHVRPGYKGISIPKAVNVVAKQSDKHGPDIALVRLPELDAREIVGRGKAFYNLEKRRGRPFSDSRPSLWAVFGAPDEQVAKDEAARMWEMRTGIYAQAEAPTRAERDGYDYAELPSLHDGQEGRPQSYAGLSGSGLWLFHGDEATGRWDTDGELEGVAFYQEYDKQTRRGVIRCHGRNSIYALLDSAP